MKKYIIFGIIIKDRKEYRMRKNIFLYILFTTILFCIPLYIKADYDAVINGSDVRIRSGATTNSDILYSVNSNTALTVVDKTLYEGDGCSSKWYKVIYKNKTGYVCSKYIKFVKFYEKFIINI